MLNQKASSATCFNLETARHAVETYLRQLQNRISQFLLAIDPSLQIQEDNWQHYESGGGITRGLVGAVIEKAGVNFSHVRGNSLPTAATLKRPELANAPFNALGVSVVIHPKNPFAPTTHLNVRFISVAKDEPVWWFGGGFDLTPYYGFVADCQHWHRQAKAACDPFGTTLYSTYKKWADDYFYLPHRQEARGVGGIFFDDVNLGAFESSFALMKSVGDHFLLAYEPILSRRMNHPYEQKHRDFQCYRRGRYVEFNLLYDRGTLFGLQSQGRTESILISLPPLVAWNYNWQPEANSLEADLYQNFLPPKEWI